MARGRKPDNPADQQAKGYPGRRAARRSICSSSRSVFDLRDAKLFADAGSGSNLQALPGFRRTNLSALRSQKKFF